MNVGNILLIKFLLTIFFCLKDQHGCPLESCCCKWNRVEENFYCTAKTFLGAFASKDVYGVFNHSVNLDISLPQGKSRRIEWKMGTKQIGWLSSSNIFVQEPEKYELFPNGTLKIKRLEKTDAGDYEVQIYDQNGISNNLTITLYVVEPLPSLNLTYECSKKILSCEVKYNKKPMPSFKLFQEKEEEKTIQYANMMWKVTQKLKNDYGKASCEASISTSLQKTETQVSCPAELDLFLIMYIGGGIVIFVIFVAILICCIRKKKAERRALEAEERELRPVNDALKYRKLPQPPVHAAPSQPHPQQRQPPPSTAVQQQPLPPLPRPRPQQKPPRRMKDKL